jgi:outer membrane protein TolC
MHHLWIPGWILCLLAAPAAAQDPGRLTLEEAVRHALTVSPALAAAVSARAGAGEAVREARAGWWPQLAVEASVVRHGEPMVVAPIHGFTPDRLPDFDRSLIQGRVAAGYTVFDGGTRGGRVAGARALEDAARARVEVAIDGVAAGAVRAYMEVLAAAGEQDAESLRLRALQAEADRVERFLAEGRAAEVDRFRVQAAVARAEADLAAAAQRVAVAEAELARWTGLPAARVRAGTLVPARATDDGVPDAALLRERARTTNPDLRAALHRVEAANTTLRLATATWFPVFRLEGRLLRFDAAESPGSTEWQAGARVSWPLFTGGGRPAAVARARAGVAEAEALRREAELAWAGRLDRAVARVLEADQRAAALAAAARHQGEVARIEALALAEGAGTQAEYLRTEAELALARSALVQAESLRVTARADLAAAVGGLSPETLSTFVRTER